MTGKVIYYKKEYYFLTDRVRKARHNLLNV